MQADLYEQIGRLKAVELDWLKQKSFLNRLSPKRAPIELNHKEIELLFEGAKQNGFNTLTRDFFTTVDGEHGRIETRDFISSLPNDARRFAEAARGHWAVEKNLHWCLDQGHFTRPMSPQATSPPLR
jgi:hypothetical protein